MVGPLAYIGGKNRLVNTIIPLLPEHRIFVEPFFGGGQIFFHKAPSAVEVINDLNGEVVNFFRICQSHHEELLRVLKFMVVSREWFQLFQKMQPEVLTDIQRAARFFYLQKNAFGGRVVRQNYAGHVVQRPNFDPLKLPSLLEATHQRLARVQIECLPYNEVLYRYDRTETLFYLDPPYWNRKLYKFNFNEDQFREMAALLAKLKGRFLLSLNDEPEVRALFSVFRCQPISLHYTAQRKAGKRYRELLIRNF